MGSGVVGQEAEVRGQGSALRLPISDFRPSAQLPHELGTEEPAVIEDVAVVVDTGDAGRGGVEDFGTRQHLWMRQHAPLFGFYHPAWAGPRGSRPEPWHWEFDEPKAQAARAAGRFATPKVTA